MKQTNANRPLPAGGMIQTTTIFTDNLFINHGIQWPSRQQLSDILPQAQLHPGNQNILTQMERKAGWGSRSRGARPHCLFFFPVREGGGLIVKGASGKSGSSSLLYLHIRLSGHQSDIS